MREVRRFRVIKKLRPSLRIHIHSVQARRERRRASALSAYDRVVFILIENVRDHEGRAERGRDVKFLSVVCAARIGI